jgi:hypothetical protein
MMPKVVSLNGLPVPRDTFIAAGTVTAGMLVILDNSGSGVGSVKNFAASDADFASTALEGGLVGVALHGATDTQPVQVALLVAGMALDIETYSTAPTAAILGVDPTTYYTLRNDAGTPKVNLGTTTNGVARLVNYDWTDAVPLTTTDRGYTPTMTGAAGDRVLITFPEAVRHYK